MQQEDETGGYMDEQSVVQKKSIQSLPRDVVLREFFKGVLDFLQELKE